MQEHRSTFWTGMRNTLSRGKLIAALVVGLAATAATTPAHASGTEWYGCPVGAVCLYEGLLPNPGRILYVWWEGANQMHNVYGDHLLLNNQTDGWVVDICRGWSGNDCVDTIEMDVGIQTNFTPINSVNLHPRR